MVEDHFSPITNSINAHCHLELTALGRLKNKGFVPWVEELMGRKRGEGLGVRDQVQKGIRSGLKRLSDSGVTTVFDHVSFDTSLETFQNAPIRVELFGEVVGSRPEVSRKIYDELRRQKDIYGPQLHITPHAIHTVPPEILKEIFQNEPKPFSIHMNESQAEMDYFQNRGDMWCKICEITKNNGKNPHGKTSSAIAYCAEQGLSLDHCLIVHANYLSDHDIQILKGSKNICVVHCPSSHAFFGHKPFPYERLRDNGIPVALGTDSVCSGSTLNMTDEIHLFWTQFPKITKEEMIAIACQNALIPFLF